MNTGFGKNLRFKSHFYGAYLTLENTQLNSQYTQNFETAAPINNRAKDRIVDTGLDPKSLQDG